LPSREQWRDRFERWSNEKTRAALAAALCAYVSELEQPRADAQAIGNAWTRQLFDGPFYVSVPHDPARPACSLVFVQSADGNTGADDPGTLGGGGTDKHLIYEGLSRVAADAVMAGAQTVRGSDAIFSVWHPELVSLRKSLGLPRHPVQIVATTRGIDLDAELIFNVPDVHVIVLMAPSAVDAMRSGLAVRPWVTPVAIENGADMRDGFARLRSMGITILSCVGGRTLASTLLEAGLVDDVYLTTAPHAGGEPGTPLNPAAWRGRTVLRKRGTGEEAGVRFDQIVPSATA
jgi:riboflavin biosynthesis pyrimidine reductase